MDDEPVAPMQEDWRVGMTGTDADVSRREARADQREIDAEVRDSEAEVRDSEAEDRERTAHERDRLADQRAVADRAGADWADGRDLVADQRDRQAELRAEGQLLRDRLADQREVDAEIREGQAEERDKQADQRAVALHQRERDLQNRERVIAERRRRPGLGMVDGPSRAKDSGGMDPGNQQIERSDRQLRAEATYERLFGPRDTEAPDSDPELMEILRGFIFGDVYGTGVLDDQTRELITVTVLACLQALPQLKLHTAAALTVGVEPVQIREAVYQLAPFVGFPRTLSSVAAVNEAFADHGIELPLPDQATVADPDRYAQGLAEQAPLYGNEIKDNLADLPAPFNEALPRFLTEFCFGDFYTRRGLTLAQRELLVLCALAAMGDTAAQLAPHGRACIQVGHSKTVVVAALVHCFPYIGFPRAVAAIRAVKNL